MLEPATTYTRLLAHVETHGNAELTALIAGAGDVAPESFETVTDAMTEDRLPESAVRLELHVPEEVHANLVWVIKAFGIGIEGHASLSEMLVELLRLAPDTLLEAAAKAATRRAIGCIECHDLTDEIGLAVHPDLAARIQDGVENRHRQAVLAGPETLLERDLGELRDLYGRDGNNWEGWVLGRPGEGGKPLRQGYELAGDGVAPVKYFRAGGRPAAADQA